MAYRWIVVSGAALALQACVPAPPAAGDAFEVAEGLELTVWASEPLLVNPTNFDIDERGRVWFVESVNYRSDLKSKPKHDEAGDRIVILEDTDGDGAADARKVFDQHADMLAPLGISVLGNQVLVSQSPDLIVYTKDEDDRILSKETLLTGWRGVDHDHGLHAVLFGHDGRYYFNSGDQGFETTDRSGNRFRSSREGPYYAATVQTVKPDGTDFRVLAHNARNPYEIAFDSFGSIWQTDNDDDGNQWTRLLYVLEGANFGYWGPGGRRWREDRGSHFHEERPGTTPYVARTGPGSPTGLAVYEGELLPDRYRNQLLHAEPGKRLIQTFRVQPDGAGYALETENTVVSTDPDFRPSDIAVAPDGSVFIADWQDPVVGGHNMQDIERGRIFRLAPPGHRSAPPDLDLESRAGLLAAFGSPNQATRYRAYRDLTLRGADERAEILREAWGSRHEALRARSLWLLAPLGAAGNEALEEAMASEDPRFRILGLRVARLHGLDFGRRVRDLAADPAAQVRREAAVMLRDLPAAEKLGPWLELADGYDGLDRWYLDALRIAATGAEDELFEALRKRDPAWNAKGADLYRILQAPRSRTFLIRAMRDATRPLEQRLQALDAVGWQAAPAIARAVAGLASQRSEAPALRSRALYFLRMQLFSEWSSERGAPQVLEAVGRSLEDPATRPAALELAALLAYPALGPPLRAIALDSAASEAQRTLALRTLGAVGDAAALALLERQALEGPVPLRIAALEGLGANRPDNLDRTLEAVVLSEAPNEVRSAALRILARRPTGLRAILDLEESQRLPPELRSTAAGLAHASRNAELRARAAKVLPVPRSRNDRPVYRVREIVEAVGSVERGRRAYRRKAGANCAKCHSLEAGEELVGPSLAAVASKYGKEGLLDAILNPSAGIAPEYVSWIFDTASHGLVTGIVVEDTPERVVVRTEAADEIILGPADILERRQGRLSIMPDDLAGGMTKQELIDLLAFLTTLRADAPAPSGD